MAENDPIHSWSTQDVSNSRQDLIKRLFAVTISVGFATQLSRIVFEPSFISGNQLNLGPMFAARWKEVGLLLISLITVIGSWDGYLSSTARRPLEDKFRFFVDIAIVFTYLLLMLSSQFFDLWFVVLETIFTLYVMWDLGSIRFSRSKGQSEFARRPPEWSISVTLTWLIPLTAIIFLKSLGSTVGFVCAAGSSLYCVCMYRLDKHFRYRWSVKLLFILMPICALVSVRIWA